MDALPSEIIAHILSMTNESTLRKCMLVNHRLHTHAQKCLYTSVEFEVKSFDKFFNAISSKVQESPNFCVQYIEEFALYMTDVLNPQEEDDDYEYSDDEDDIVFNQTADVEDIQLMISTKIVELLPRLLNLKKLRLPIVIWERFSDFRSTLQSCGRLEDVVCPTNFIEDLAHLFSDQLRYLTVINSGQGFLHVHRVSFLFPNLESLDMSWCQIDLSVELLENIAKNCQKLSRLYLRGCKYSSLQDKEEAIMTVSSLDTLVISIDDLDSLWLSHIAKRYPDLRELQLTIAGNPDWSISPRCQDGFLAIANGCTKLEDLYCLTVFSPGGLNLNQDFFNTFSQRAKNGLKSLNLKAGANVFEDEDLLNIAMCVGRTLTKLELEDCPLISMKGLSDALKHFSALQSLTLSVSEFALSILLENCPDIDSFSLNNATILRDAHRSDNYRPIALTYLSLHDVENADFLVDAVSQYCPKLRHIVMTELHFDPSTYTTSLFLPDNVIQNISVEWVRWDSEDIDPIYFKITQSPIPGEPPVTHWCLHSGKEPGMFYLVDPDTVPSNAICYNITVRTLYNLAFRLTQSSSTSSPPKNKKWPGKPVSRKEAAKLTSKQLLNLLPAPIPLQRSLELPNELFDLYTTSINNNSPAKK